MEADGSLYTQPRGRIIGFDFLRCIAILLTLCRHSFRSTNIFWQIGWTGVHIFFVLSSYLIANILFTEYYKTGKIKFFRFFTRRALKIYPLYYLFILISVYKNKELFLSSAEYKMQLLGQVFHVQNYTGNLWYHTWSLAAEEHFYIGICIMLSVYLFFTKFGSLRQLSWPFLAIVILAPIFRYRATMLYHTDWFMGTHFIMDSFAFGTLVALSKFVFPRVFSFLIQQKHWLLLPVFILLIPVLVLPPGNLFLNSTGCSLMFLAFALLLVWLLSVEVSFRSNQLISKAIVYPLASIGTASYSIYLFHVPVKTFIDNIVASDPIKTAAYFICCIVVGKISWYLVEKPIATFKSRFIPS